MKKRFLCIVVLWLWTTVLLGADVAQNSVRLLVQTPSNRPHTMTFDNASGTLVETSTGETMVLTCWHFNHPSASVTLERGGRSYSGTRIAFDQENDVALWRLQGSPKLGGAKLLAHPEEATYESRYYHMGYPAAGPLYGNYTRRVFREAWTNRNIIQTDYRCREGESGGGLYILDDEGKATLAGVCSFRDRRGTHGAYMGPAAIHALFKSAGIEPVTFCLQRPG